MLYSFTLLNTPIHDGFVFILNCIINAEEVARKAALYSGLFWLISAILTFVAAIAGAKSAATSHRLDRPIVTYGDNVR